MNVQAPFLPRLKQDFTLFKGVTLFITLFKALDILSVAISLSTRKWAQEGKALLKVTQGIDSETGN